MGINKVIDLFFLFSVYIGKHVEINLALKFVKSYSIIKFSENILFITQFQYISL